MTELINRTWDLLNITVDKIRSQDSSIELNDDAKKLYEQLFQDKYHFIMDTFMKNTVQYLDRHKVASIIMASLIEANAVIYNQAISQDETFFGKYQIAVSVGLSYMLDRLNARLLEKDKEAIEKYWFPAAFSCSTPYFEIFARNLYFTCERTQWKLNLLDMSEILYLLEYMTLKENGIDPSILNEE